MLQRKIKIALFEHQEDFLYSEYPSTGLVAGFGSGKSYVGTIKSCKKLSELKCNIGYYLPTYQLIKDIAFENFTNILDTFRVPHKLHESDKVFYTDYGNVYLRSMDNPSNIIGYETGYSLIDEADILPTDKMSKAYKAIVSRNRTVLPKGYVNATDMVSTPEGFKFLYEYYVKNSNKRRKLIQANTLDNTTLPQSYIDNLYDTYPAEQLEAYMKGQFVNLTTGTVYRDFDRKKNIDNSKEAGSNILYIGMDFNITKMACTIAIKEGDNRYVIDEIVDEYDTSDIVKEIQKRYPNNRIFVYPDAAGAARNTSGKSDHDILRKAGFKVNVPSKNPFVRDRINSVNKEFADCTTFINSNRCPSLVSALEKQSYNKNGEPDKSTGHDHVLDGFGYEVHNSKVNQIKVRTSNAF